MIVETRDLYQLICEICKMLDRLDTVEPCHIGDRTFLMGEITRIGELGRVVAISERYPIVHVLAKPSPELIARRLREIDIALIRAGFPRLRAAADASGLRLEGQMRTDQEIAKAQALAEAMYAPIAEFTRRVRVPK